MYLKINGQLKEIKLVGIEIFSKNNLRYLKTEQGWEEIYLCPSVSSRKMKFQQFFIKDFLLCSDVKSDHGLNWIYITLIFLESTEKF